RTTVVRPTIAWPIAGIACCKLADGADGTSPTAGEDSPDPPQALRIAQDKNRKSAAKLRPGRGARPPTGSAFISDSQPAATLSTPPTHSLRDPEGCLADQAYLAAQCRNMQTILLADL